MKLLVLTTSYPRSEGDDAGIFVERLVKSLEAKGISGTVIVPFDRSERREENRGSFVIKRFKYGLLSKGALAFGSGILPNIRANKALVFQIPGLLLAFFLKAKESSKSHDVVQANWLITGLVAYLNKIATGRRYLLTLRGEDMKLVSSALTRFIFLPVLKSADILVTVNREFSERLVKLGLSREKIHVIPNGVSVEFPPKDKVLQFAAQNSINLQSKIIIYVGRMIALKRIEVLIELISRTNLSDYTLLLCGRLEEQYAAQLYRQVSDLGLSERVIFRGLVAPSEIPMYLACSSVYMSASEYEGRPNSVLEALCAGVPTLVSDIPAHREVISDGQNGFLFNTEKLEDAEAILLKLEKDPGLKDKISAAAKQSMQPFAWESTADRYRQVLDSILRSSLANS